MTLRISKMELLCGRIAYRKAWALQAPQTSKPFRQKDRKWELEYDDENNFAHMGARYVDEHWGLMKPPKLKPKQLSPEVMRLLELMRSEQKTVQG